MYFIPLTSVCKAVLQLCKMVKSATEINLRHDIMFGFNANDMSLYYLLNGLNVDYLAQILIKLKTKY